MERVWGLLLVLLLSFLPGEAWAEVREYTLTVTEGTLNLKGLTFPVWAFNGVVPGPEIRVKEGEKVRIRLKNRSGAYHTLTFHGLHVPFQMAGVPGFSQAPVGPGEEFTYEFVAKPSGTHYYHCNVNAAEHLDRGMYGPFIVEASGEPKADREWTVILDEWSSKAARGEGHEPGHPRGLLDYDITTINGKAIAEAPLIIQARVGEQVRVRLINVGYLPHTLELPDPGFTITHEDGYPLPVPRKETSLTVYSGKRYDIVITLQAPGRWPVRHTKTLPQGIGVRREHQRAHREGHERSEEILKEDLRAIILEAAR